MNAPDNVETENRNADTREPKQKPFGFDWEGARPEGVESVRLFGGRGSVWVWDLLAGKQASPFSAVLNCELAAGGSVGAHVQQRDPEILVGLEGEGVATVDGVSHALAPGRVVYLKLGGVLAIENPSPLPLRYLIIKSQTAPSRP